MNEITNDKLFELFLDTIARCTSSLRDCSDDEIAYELFEEFDVGAWTFLHDNNLAKLRCAGYIDNETVETGRDLRKKWLSLQARNSSMEEIRASGDWLELFELSDGLRLKLLHAGRPEGKAHLDQ